MPKTTLLRKQVTPTGSIQPLAGDVIPDGYLQCDGSIVNIADYPKLHAVVGFAHGNGNNDGLTFHLPDLRGRFLRGTDNGAGRDPDAGTRTAANAGGNAGDNVGSIEGDDTKPHNHNAGDLRFSNRSGGTGSFNDSSARGNSGVNYVGLISGAVALNSGTETRPVNANVNYIIKAV